MCFSHLDDSGPWIQLGRQEVEEGENETEGQEETGKKESEKGMAC